MLNGARSTVLGAPLMALTATARTKAGTARAPSVQAGSPLPTRERRPGYVALAVVLIVGLAAVGAWLYAGAGAKVPVLKLNKEVQAGQIIQRSDLTTISVAGDGRLSAVEASDIDLIAGKPAAMRLPVNTLVLRAMVRAPGSELPGGTVQLGIAVKPGQLPAGGLQPGDKVSVFAIPEESADATVTATKIGNGLTVSTVRPNPSENGGTLLTLDIPPASNPARQDAVVGFIATAAAAGRISIVKAGQ